MVKQLKFAVECRNGYLPGKEEKYVRCILDKAAVFAERNPRGEDKHIVRRAIVALKELQAQNPDGASRQQIRLKAGFTSYKGTGLWPWRAKHGGLPVVEKRNDQYRIVDRFYPAVRKVI